MILHRLPIYVSAILGILTYGITSASAQIVDIDASSFVKDFNGTADTLNFGLNSGTTVFSATMSGGTVTTNVNTYNYSQVAISGGTASTLQVFGNSVVTVSGGTLSHAASVYNQNSFLTIAGGTFTNINAGTADVYDYSNLTLVGDLTQVGSPAVVSGGLDYTYVGSLADNQISGTYLVFVNNGASLTIVPSSAVPEPSALALTLVGGLTGAGFLLRSRKK